MSFDEIISLLGRHVVVRLKSTLVFWGRVVGLVPGDCVLLSTSEGDRFITITDIESVEEDV